MSTVRHYLAGILDDLKPRLPRICLPWRHDWEDTLTDVPTCLRCLRRQLIPREPFDIGD